MWFLAIGIARIAIGIADRGAPWVGMLVLNGLLSLALGLLIALQLPDSATWASGLLVGIDSSSRGHSRSASRGPWGSPEELARPRSRTRSTSSRRSSRAPARRGVVR